MTRYCLNCGRRVSGKYCSHCSQSTDVGPINWNTFVQEFLHTLTHAERSILGTTLQLIKTPGKVLNEYIEGKRKKYHGPVGFFLIWITISIITQRSVIAYTGFDPVLLQGLTFNSVRSIEAFVIHGQWFYLFTFPIHALTFYLILARPKFSYLECIVITMYSFSITYLFFVVSYLIGGFIFSVNVLHWEFYLFQVLLSVTYFVWVTFDLLKTKGIRFLWWRLSLQIVLTSVIDMKLLEFLSNSWVKIEEYFV